MSSVSPLPAKGAYRAVLKSQERKLISELHTWIENC